MSEAGVQHALLVALGKRPNSQTPPITAPSKILDDTALTTHAKTSNNKAVKVNDGPCSQSNSDSQHEHSDRNLRKRARITYTPERSLSPKRFRSNHNKGVDENNRHKSLSPLRRRRNSAHYSRRSEPLIPYSNIVNMENVINGACPLRREPSNIDLSFSGNKLGKFLPELDTQYATTSAIESADNAPICSPSTSTTTSILAASALKNVIVMDVNGSALTLFFTNKYIFSNHFIVPFKAHGIQFNCSEQYYMYHKARFFDDMEIANLILAATNPKEMKRLGRQISRFDKQKWDEVCVSVMKTACYEKFVQNMLLRKELFKTVGTTLVEASPMDNFWGVGLAMDDINIRNPRLWRGKNILGFILTHLREYLMTLSEYAPEVTEVMTELKKVHCTNNIVPFE